MQSPQAAIGSHGLLSREFGNRGFQSAVTAGRARPRAATARAATIIRPRIVETRIVPDCLDHSLLNRLASSPVSASPVSSEYRMAGQRRINLRSSRGKSAHCRRATLKPPCDIEVDGADATQARRVQWMGYGACALLLRQSVGHRLLLGPPRAQRVGVEHVAIPVRVCLPGHGSGAAVQPQSVCGSGAAKVPLCSSQRRLEFRCNFCCSFTAWREPR